MVDEAVGARQQHYCTSCYTGQYPVAFPRDENAYLQLTLKLDGHESAPRRRTRRRRLGASSLRRASDALCVACVAVLVRRAQERGPPATSPADLRAAIDQLGDLDYATRSKAGALVRRTPAAQAVPALLQAVREHEDGYVRFRSLVLLTGFNDPRAADQMEEALARPTIACAKSRTATSSGIPTPR